MKEAQVNNQTDEDTRSILELQHDAYFRIQDQAQSVLRSIIAGIAIILTSMSLLIQYIWPNIEIPKRTITAAGGALTYEGFYQPLATGSQYVGFMIVGVGFVLFLDSTRFLFSILRKSQLGPGMGRRLLRSKKEFQSSRYLRGDPGLDEWILSNNEILDQLKTDLNRSYERIRDGLLVTLVGCLAIASVFIGNVALIGVIHLVIAVIGPILITAEILKSLSKFYRGYKRDGVRTGILATRNYIIDISGRSPGPLYLSVIVSIYLYAWIFSTISLIILSEAVFLA